MRYANMEIDFTVERLVEIASKAIDGLLEDDRESAMEYFKEEMELSDYEMKFFGIAENEDFCDYEYDNDFDSYDEDDDDFYE